MKCLKHGELKENEFYIQKIDGKWDTHRCRLCNRESASESKKRRRNEVNAWTRQDRKLNPEKYREYEKRNRAKDPARTSETEIARRLGLTRKEYQDKLESQNAVCAICGKCESRKLKDRVMRLTLDHCHKTGKVRQFLCHNCNTGIGKFNDSIDILESAINYLRRHNG